MCAVLTVCADATLTETMEGYCGVTADKTEKGYFCRYKKIREKLEPYQIAVEKAASAQALISWREEYAHRLSTVNDDEVKKDICNAMWQECPLFYLNNHGPSHICTVIERAKDILLQSTTLQMNAYELFLLLCAIEVHDIGNIFGRDGHEKRIAPVVEKIDGQLLDSFEKNTITKIAMTHGGKIEGNKDTISVLAKSRVLFRHTVREQMLAAILRLADELADDNSRASKAEMDLDVIPDESKIFHRYSEALHTVLVEDGIVKLYYEFTSDVAIEKYKCGEQEKYLLDEIYERTMKMERERRYCMRYLRPHISIEAIRVDIQIQNSNNPLESIPITYSLYEMGYPTDPTNKSMEQYIGSNPTGENIAKRLNERSDIDATTIR